MAAYPSTFTQVLNRPGMLLIDRPDTDDYREIFLTDTPLMDVRAPAEYAKGAFPLAENQPLLDDLQRQQIGIRYQETGEQAAIQLGLDLATEEIRAQRIAHWREFCKYNPQGYLYCFRGGLRSHTTQSWLREAGIDYPLITGGYKAMRHFLINELQLSIDTLQLINICGPTGAGKTRVLKQIHHHVDFEGLAQHRGSSFGRNLNDHQPSTIDWENAVSIAMLKHRHQHASSPLFLEDEGRQIGRVMMPANLNDAMTTNQLAIITEPLNKRVAMTIEDYVTLPWQEYQRCFGDNAQSRFSAFVLDSLARIQKRLGNQRYRAIQHSFNNALDHLFATGESGAFAEGVETLLSQYYDPMYEYQLTKHQGKVLFQGSGLEVIEWANNQASKLSEL